LTTASAFAGIVVVLWVYSATEFHGNQHCAAEFGWISGEKMESLIIFNSIQVGINNK